MRRRATGSALFVAGEIVAGMFVIISGKVEVSQRDPFGHVAPIVEQGPRVFGRGGVGVRIWSCGDHVALSD
jgi:thioredoxin reductase (NADPH)